MRIGLLSSGIFWQDFGMRKSGFPYDVLYIYKKGWTFDDYDVLVVPKGIDQEYLKTKCAIIADWLNRGGVIVSFGEADGNWLPETSWQPSTVGQLSTLAEEGHPLFSGLSEAEVHPWSKAVHGYFDRIPARAKVLATVSGGPTKTIAYVDDNTRRGAVLAMTYDPDYHTYSEIPFAQIMLNNAVAWANDTAQRIRSMDSSHSELRDSSIWQMLRARIGVRTLISIVIGLAVAAALKLVLH